MHLFVLFGLNAYPFFPSWPIAPSSCSSFGSPFESAVAPLNERNPPPRSGRYRSVFQRDSFSRKTSVVVCGERRGIFLGGPKTRQGLPVFSQFWQRDRRQRRCQHG